MRKWMGLTALVVVLALLTGCASAEGLYYGSYPETGVFVTQTSRHTCTLIAATMMLRNYAFQRGHKYADMTETNVRQYAWTKQYGLSQHFTVDQMEVCCSAEIGKVADKKNYLIMCLREHREGIVIYDTGAPHAIYLFGYDEDTDTFYCADTINRIGGQAIPLVESIIKGETQEDKIKTIDKIWYVA